MLTLKTKVTHRSPIKPKRSIAERYKVRKTEAIFWEEAGTELGWKAASTEATWQTWTGGQRDIKLQFVFRLNGILSFNRSNPMNWSNACLIIHMSAKTWQHCWDKAGVRSLKRHSLEVCKRHRKEYSWLQNTRIFDYLSRPSVKWGHPDKKASEVSSAN